MSFQFIPNKHVEVPDIPFKDHLVLEAKDTALIIVDMQNEFVKEGGSLVVPSAIESVANIRSLLGLFRSSGAKVVYTQDTHIKDDPEAEVWPEHCVIGTWGWQIISELEPRSEDLICTKNRYDGFYGTWLDHFLSKVWGIKNLIIVGTVSNICVLHTAASAGLRYYHVVVPADGITAITEFGQALTLHQVSSLYNGTVLRSVKDLEFSPKKK